MPLAQYNYRARHSEPAKGTNIGMFREQKVDQVQARSGRGKSRDQTLSTNAWMEKHGF